MFESPDKGLKQHFSRFAIGMAQVGLDVFALEFFILRAGLLFQSNVGDQLLSIEYSETRVRNP